MKIHPVTKYFWNALILCLGVIALGLLVYYILRARIEVVVPNISTVSWYKSLHLLQFVVASGIFVFCTLIIILTLAFYERRKNLETVSGNLDSSKDSFNQIKAVQILSHIGRIVIKFPEEIISLDQQFSVLFPNIDLEKIPKDLFISKIHKSDQEFFHHMLVEINDQNVSYTWADLRIGEKTSGYRHYHIYGNVQRNPEGKLDSFLGVMQDITNIK